MTVETTARKQSFAGGQSSLEFSFRALAGYPEDIKVVVVTSGTETILTYTTHYTVTINTDGIGGFVHVIPSYSTAYTYTVYRETTNKQESDYDDYNQFPADTLEEDIDRRTLISQELEEDIARSVKLPVSSSLTDINLPSPSAGKSLKWNAGETGFENTTQDIDAVTLDAANYASTASTQAALASNYASTASTQATAAGNYASTASTQATLAGNYASTASTQATTASTQATLSGLYATTASTQAALSGLYATTASTQASLASLYATTASTQATLAGVYATTASTAATTASTQATLAGNYATTASTQATLAGLYATTASTAATLAGNYATSLGTVTLQNVFENGQTIGITASSLQITSSSTKSTLNLVANGNGRHINFSGDPTLASPADGDMWFTGSALNFRNGTSTVNLLSGTGIVFTSSTLYSGTASTTFTDLNLNSLVGSNSSIVLIKARAVGATIDIKFRQNGDTLDQGLESASYYGIGCTGASIADGRAGYLLAVTDSSGITEWKCVGNNAVTISSIAFIR